MRIQGANQLNHAAEQRINLRTHGRIHGLQVEIEGDKATVRGRTGTYYTKQLALHAALEFANEVELDIEVGKSQSSRNFGHR